MHKYSLGLIGFTSGIVSYYTSNSFDTRDTPGFLPYDLCAGIIFGIAISFFVFFFLPSIKKSRFWLLQLASWIIVSMVSYYFAVHTTVTIIDPASSNYAPQPFIEYLAFFVGGSLGAFLMLLGFHFLLVPIKQYRFIVLVILGGILGLSSFLGTNSLNPLFVLFIVWQTGMAFGLGWCLDQNKVNNYA